MAVIGSRIGIDEKDNSAKLRAERRIFEAEKAEASALQQRKETADVGRAAMISPAPKPTVPYLPEAEEEGPLGEIMKASPAGMQTAYERMPIEERPIELIRGTERTYWSPGTRQEYGDIRTAMTGFKPRPEAERRDAGVATDMTLNQKVIADLAERKFGFEQSQAMLDYVDEKVESAAVLMRDKGKALTQDQTILKRGKASVDWINAANISDADKKAMISRIPYERGKKDKTGEILWYNAYGKPVKTEPTVRADVEPETLPEVPTPTLDDREMPTPGLSEEKLAAVTKTAAQRAAVAARLREIHEKKTQPPMIGARTLGKFKKAWGEREESPYVETPAGLRGYR